MCNFFLYYVKQKRVNLPAAFKEAKRQFCKEYKPIIITGYRQVGGVRLDLKGNYEVCISVEWDDSLVKNENA